MYTIFEQIAYFIREIYNTPEGFISLHEPRFIGNEKKYLADCIDSTFVSSVGPFVEKFEDLIKDYTKIKYAIAVSNGTAALHLALQIAGVKANDLVITQPLSFIATCNAITYQQAAPIFIDVDPHTLGLSYEKLKIYLEEKTQIKNKECFHKDTGQRIAACVPMHTFGHPCQIDQIVSLCDTYGIPVVEDAAESIGSLYDGKHTGTFGALGVYSFNGNKTITSGGGGVIITNTKEYAKLAKHLSTQAKVPHPWDFVHDMIGYNYRMPNINAALACAQIEQLDLFLQAKREQARQYAAFFASTDYAFIYQPKKAISNYWLNAILMKSKQERDDFLAYTNKSGVMTRPCWRLMPELEMFKNSLKADLSQAYWFADRLVNIPSSVPVNSIRRHENNCNS